MVKFGIFCFLDDFLEVFVERSETCVKMICLLKALKLLIQLLFLLLQDTILIVKLLDLMSESLDFLLIDFCQRFIVLLNVLKRSPKYLHGIRDTRLSRGLSNAILRPLDFLNVRFLNGFPVFLIGHLIL